MIDEQTLRDATARHGDEIPPNTVELPGPSTWPCLLAFGLALSAMGVLTMWVVFYVGCAITAIAALGFFNAVFPREKVWYAEIEEPQPTVLPRGSVEHLTPGMAGHRIQLPEKVHPYRAGLYGGLFGGAAMGVVALIYTVIWLGSWAYSLNVLAAMLLPSYREQPIEFYLAWEWTGVLFGAGIHIVLSISIGLVYAVVLPMMGGKRLAMILGSLVGPLIFTGLLWPSVAIISEPLANLVWNPDSASLWWFIGSQFAFGFACTWWILRAERRYTPQWIKHYTTPEAESRSNA